MRFIAWDAFPDFHEAPPRLRLIEGSRAKNPLGGLDNYTRNKTTPAICCGGIYGISGGDIRTREGYKAWQDFCREMIETLPETCEYLLVDHPHSYGVWRRSEEAQKIMFGILHQFIPDHLFFSQYGIAGDISPFFSLTAYRTGDDVVNRLADQDLSGKKTSAWVRMVGHENARNQFETPLGLIGNLLMLKRFGINDICLWWNPSHHKKDNFIYDHYVRCWKVSMEVLALVQGLPWELTDEAWKAHEPSKFDRLLAILTEWDSNGMERLLVHLTDG